ncbi:hypothetical protein SLE2022_403440 [Rubroshorea leprosula]
MNRSYDSSRFIKFYTFGELRAIVYLLVLRRSFQWLLAFCYFRYLLAGSAIIFAFFYLIEHFADGPTFVNHMVPADGKSGSDGPSTPPSLSDSLIAHGSDESNSEKELFFSPRQSVSSASSSSTSTPGIEGSPNNGENKEQNTFYYIEPGSEEHEAMKESVIRILRGKLEEWEASGDIDGFISKKTNEELADILNLYLVQSKESMELCIKEILGFNCEKLTKVPKGSPYASFATLVGEHRRKTGLE